MNKEIPYYILDLKGNSERLSSNNPAYIDDEELRDGLGYTVLTKTLQFFIISF